MLIYGLPKWAEKFYWIFPVELIEKNRESVD